MNVVAVKEEERGEGDAAGFGSKAQTERKQRKSQDQVFRKEYKKGKEHITDRGQRNDKGQWQRKGKW